MELPHNENNSFYNADSSSCSSFEDCDEGFAKGPRKNCDRESTNEVLLSRSIIHLDIDCFYCQSEELRQPHLKNKPFAIGQKHIIVTCNYVARKLGLKKLMSRESAYGICPHLIIVEGSDLFAYRQDSRLVYSEFRRAVKDLVDNLAGSRTLRFSTKKGGMDEMFADLSHLVDYYNDNSDVNTLSSNRDNSSKLSGKEQSSASQIFVYGNDSASKNVNITEDQTGANAVIQTFSGCNNSDQWGTLEERNRSMKKLDIASKLALQIKEKVRIKTGFSCSVGVSVNPMLAKLASDLQKPNSLNILFPWRSSNIIQDMPLRRIPELGSRTLKAIVPHLLNFNGGIKKRKDEFWTCRELLRVPRNTLVLCLSNQELYGASTEKFCDLILNRCNGVDTMEIVDDNGGLTKTVSVEDSFIRGSLTSIEGVKKELNKLFVRLPKLLEERKICSSDPNHAYPKVIRLSVRFVDKQISLNEKRRPFRTISKQAPFNGKVLLESSCEEEVMSFQCKAILPLLDTLVQQCSCLSSDIDITKLNIAAVNFADLDSLYQKKNSITSHFSSASKNQPNAPHSFQRSLLTKEIFQQKPTGVPSEIQTALVIGKKGSTPFSLSSKRKHSGRQNITPDEIDPSFLAELPPDIAKEVLENQKYHQQMTSCGKKKMKKQGIKHFFKKK